MLHFVYFVYIFFKTLDKGLNLLLFQLKWLEWKNDEAELSTTDIGLAPNLDKVQVLCCRWLNN